MTVSNARLDRFRISTVKYIAMAISVVPVFAGFGLYLLGSIDFVKTAAHWLRTGEWEAVRTSLFVMRHLEASDFRVWLENPQDWIGLRTAAGWLFLDWPFFAVGIVYGLALCGLGFSLFVRATELAHVPEIPLPLPTDEGGDRETDWGQFCEEIEAMLKSGAYDFADNSLRGMQASIRRYKAVTPGQRMAVENLKAAKSRFDQFSG